MKVGIIGAGLMGQWHAHFAKLCGADIVGIVDSNGSRGTQLAKRYNTEFFTDLEKFFYQQKPQVIHICTPTASHESLIRTSLELGANIFVEKPMTADLRTTIELIELAKSKNLVLNPVHQFPWQRGYLALLQRRDKLGVPVNARFATCSSGGLGKSSVECKEILLEILPHPVSLFCQLFEKLDVHNIALNKFSDTDLDLCLSAEDVFLTISISLRGRPTRNEFIYVGEAGTAHLDLFHGFELFEAGNVSRTDKFLKPFKYGAGIFVKAGTNIAARAAASEPAYPGLRELLHHFYESVSNKSEQPISEREILLAASLIERVRDVTV